MHVLLVALLQALQRTRRKRRVHQENRFKVEAGMVGTDPITTNSSIEKYAHIYLPLCNENVSKYQGYLQIWTQYLLLILVICSLSHKVQY